MAAAAAATAQARPNAAIDAGREILKLQQAISHDKSISSLECG
jgi:hypothetical protein